MDYSSVEKKVNTFFRRLVPENAPRVGSKVVGAYNLPCDFFLWSSLLRTSINLSLVALSLSDFWLFDYTHKLCIY